MVDNELRHRMTATEFANRQLNEIDRLRKLVKEAYHEGYKEGSSDFPGDYEYGCEMFWSKSKSREELEE